MADFVEKEEIPYPVAIDTEGKTVEAFSVDSFPDYYVIDRSGRVRAAGLANSELDRVIEILLSEQPEERAPAPTGATTTTSRAWPTGSTCSTRLPRRSPA